MFKFLFLLRYYFNIKTFLIKSVVHLLCLNFYFITFLFLLRYYFNIKTFLIKSVVKSCIYIKFEYRYAFIMFTFLLLLSIPNQNIESLCLMLY